MVSQKPGRSCGGRRAEQSSQRTDPPRIEQTRGSLSCSTCVPRQGVAWPVHGRAGSNVLCMRMYLLQVCFKQNVHKHSLEFIQAQAKAFEAVPATFTCADASSLFEDKQQKQPGGWHTGRYRRQAGRLLLRTVRTQLVLPTPCVGMVVCVSTSRGVAQQTRGWSCLQAKITNGRRHLCLCGLLCLVCTWCLQAALRPPAPASRVSAAAAMQRQQHQQQQASVRLTWLLTRTTPPPQQQQPVRRQRLQQQHSPLPLARRAPRAAGGRTTVTLTRLMAALLLLVAMAAVQRQHQTAPRRKPGWQMGLPWMRLMLSHCWRVSTRSWSSWMQQRGQQREQREGLQQQLVSAGQAGLGRGRWVVPATAAAAVAGSCG